MVQKPSTQPAPSKKKVAPITREQFRKSAPTGITITLSTKDGDLGVVLASKKEFETGSLGWYGNGRAIVNIDGVPTEVQLGFNFTVIGSKELPK